MEMNPTVSKDVNVIPTKYMKALDSYFVVVVPPFRVFPSLVRLDVLVRPRVRPHQSLLFYWPPPLFWFKLFVAVTEQEGRTWIFRNVLAVLFSSTPFLRFLLRRRRRPPFVANNDFILRILPRNRVSELYDWLTHVFVTLFNPAAANAKKKKKKREKKIK